MAVVSSCREMSGLVLQRAKPLSLVASIQLGTLERPPVMNRRKAGTTSSHHGLYGQGYTRATMGRTEGREPARGSQSRKASRSPDWSLQPDSMKLESLVIANQHCRGEYVPGP